MSVTMKELLVATLIGALRDGDTDGELRLAVDGTKAGSLFDGYFYPEEIVDRLLAALEEPSEAMLTAAAEEFPTTSPLFSDDEKDVGRIFTAMIKEARR